MKRRRPIKLFKGIKPKDTRAQGRAAREKREAPRAPKKPGRQWTRRELEPVVILNPDDPAPTRKR